MNQPNQDSELLKLATEYQDKLTKMVEKVVTAASKIGKVHGELEALKTQYKWKNFLLNVLRYISPILLLIALVLSLRFLPCGTSIDMRFATITAQKCASNR